MLALYLERQVWEWEEKEKERELEREKESNLYLDQEQPLLTEQESRSVTGNLLRLNFSRKDIAQEKSTENG